MSVDASEAVKRAPSLETRLQGLVELHFCQTMTGRTSAVAHDLREHLLKCRKETATTAAGEKVFWIAGLACHCLCELDGYQLVLR